MVGRDGARGGTDQGVWERGEDAPVLVAARAEEVCCMIVLVTTNLKGEGFEAEGEVWATRRERRVDCSDDALADGCDIARGAEVRGGSGGE